MMNLEDEDSGILLSYQIYNNEEVDEGVGKRKEAVGKPRSWRSRWDKVRSP